MLENPIVEPVDIPIQIPSSTESEAMTLLASYPNPSITDVTDCKNLVMLSKPFPPRKLISLVKRVVALLWQEVHDGKRRVPIHVYTHTGVCNEIATLNDVVDEGSK